ncbi:MAG: hypothetical protein ACFCA4_12530 [Cyanophyceae cyanobacterium]
MDKVPDIITAYCHELGCTNPSIIDGRWWALDSNGSPVQINFGDDDISDAELEALNQAGIAGACAGESFAKLLRSVDGVGGELSEELLKKLEEIEELAQVVRQKKKLVSEQQSLASMQAEVLKLLRKNGQAKD